MPNDFYSGNLPDYKPWELTSGPPKSVHISHVRTKNSHQGISNLIETKSLRAGSVNQEYLDEICELKELTSLIISGSTATNFNELKNLTKLKFFKIDFAHRSEDFSFVRSLPQLEGLYFEHLKLLTDYSFLEGLDSIKRLGIEGATNGTRQKIESLKPLGTMKGLEEIYMTIVTLKDKDLTYLAGCTNLTLFNCSRIAPKKSFEALRDCMPELKCNYCDDYRHPWER